MKKYTHTRKFFDVSRTRTGKVLFASGNWKRFTYYASHVQWSKAFFVLLIPAIIIGGIMYFRIARSQTAVFYPSSCLGGWENPQYAEGKPDVTTQGDASAFTEQNSAVLRSVASQIFCGKFLGDVPQDGIPSKAILHLSWVIKTAPQEISVPLPLGTTTDMINQEFPITTSSPEIIQTPTSTPEIMQPSEFPTVAPSPEISQTPTPTPEIVQPSEPPISWLSRFISVAFAEENIAEISPSPSASELPVVSLDPTPRILGEQATSSVDVSPEPVATDSPVPSIEIISEQSPEPSSSLEPSASNEPTIPSPSDIFGNGQGVTPVPSEQATSTPEALWEIVYTVDGTNWMSLAKIGPSDLSDIALGIPAFTWDKLSSLAISIQSLPTTNEASDLYLDALWIEVAYVSQAQVSFIPTTFHGVTGNTDDDSGNEALPSVAFQAETPETVTPIIHQKRATERKFIVSKDAKHSCFVDPFSIDIAAGQTNTVTVFLKQASSSSAILGIGDMPYGIEAKFVANNDTSLSGTGMSDQTSIQVAAYPGNQKGSFSIPIIFSIREQNLFTDTVCQFNVVSL